MKTRFDHKFEIAGLVFEIRAVLHEGRDWYAVKIKQGEDEDWLFNPTGRLDKKDLWPTHAGAHFAILLFLEKELMK